MSTHYKTIDGKALIKRARDKLNFSWGKIAWLVGWPQSTCRHKYKSESEDRDHREDNPGKESTIPEDLRASFKLWIHSDAVGLVSKLQVQRWFEQKAHPITVKQVRTLLTNTEKVKKTKTNTQQELTEEQRMKRVEWCENYLTTYGGSVHEFFKNAWYIDETYFSLRGAYPTGIVYYSEVKFPDGPPAVTTEKPYRNRTKHATAEGISVCAAISRFGATKLYRMPAHTTEQGKESKRLTTEKYMVFCKDYLIPAMERHQPCGSHSQKHAFHDQDSSHDSNQALYFSWQKKLLFHTLPVKLWLANIIEKYWGILNTEVYEGGSKMYKNEEELWDALQAAHKKYFGEHGDAPKGKKIADSMANKVPLYLKAIIREEGRHLSAAQARKISF